MHERIMETLTIDERNGQVTTLKKKKEKISKKKSTNAIPNDDSSEPKCVAINTKSDCFVLIPAISTKTVHLMSPKRQRISMGDSAAKL